MPKKIAENGSNGAVANTAVDVAASPVVDAVSTVNDDVKTGGKAKDSLPRDLASIPTQRKYVKYTTDIQSPSTPEFIFANPSAIIDQTNDIKIVYTKSSITEHELEIFEDLEKHTGTPLEHVLGISIFDSTGIHKFLSVPTLIKQNDRLFLSVGVFVKGLYKPTEIPLVWDGNAYKLGENRANVQLAYFSNNDVKYPFLVLKTPNAIHHFPIKTEQGVNYDAVDLAFEHGRLELYVTNFFGDSVALTKMFMSCFENHSFPPGGVMMVLEFKGQTEPFEGKKGTEGTKWRIVESSHPDLTVGTTQKTVCNLGDATLLFASASSELAKYQHSQPGKKVFLFIKDKNAKRIDWTPQHQVFQDSRFMFPVIRNGFATILNEHSEIQQLPSSGDHFNLGIDKFENSDGSHNRVAFDGEIPY